MIGNAERLRLLRFIFMLPQNNTRTVSCAGIRFVDLILVWDQTLTFTAEV